MEGGNKTEDEKKENWLVFHTQEGPAGVLLELSALVKTTEQAPALEWIQSELFLSDGHSAMCFWSSVLGAPW